MVGARTHTHARRRHTHPRRAPSSSRAAFPLARAPPASACLQKAMSVKEVVTYHTYQNGRPVRGGLNDPALGVIDKRATCTTCKNTYSGSGGVNDCPGHFGHVQVR